MKENITTFQEAMQNQQDGWTPTGRIDFSGSSDSEPNSDRREIRWRRATLNKAKKVVLPYHAQLDLATTANLVVSASDSDAARSELDKDEAATDDKAQG